MLWGGPLVVPNDLMGGTRRLIHAVYMFTQNFSFGIYRGLASPGRAQSRKLPASRCLFTSKLRFAE
ncbi:MAG: hypothetical protein DMG40_22720 [Acidobacteria bacterium]|nr:MAG: hypothetical protein DMG40_22720 [Acidobacteriota bacterium]